MFLYSLLEVFSTSSKKSMEIDKTHYGDLERLYYHRVQNVSAQSIAGKWVKFASTEIPPGQTNMTQCLVYYTINVLKREIFPFLLQCRP